MGHNNEPAKAVGELQIAFSNQWLQKYVMSDLLRALALSIVIIVVQIIGLLFIFKKLIRRPVEALVSAIRDSEQKCQLVKVNYKTNDELGLVIDAYNQMQLQIASHTKRQELVYNKTPALLCYINTFAKITTVSDFFCDKLGVKRNRIIGFPLSDFLLEQSVQDMPPKNIDLALVSGVPLTGVKAVLNIENSTKKTHVLLNSLPEYINNGEFLGSFCVMTDITSQVEAQTALEYQANYDLLTGLPNRYFVFEKLKDDIATCAINSQYLALAFIDIDRFKWVNDSYGHNIGDQLLIKVANRLKGAIRHVDTAGRFGGDEFLIIFPFLMDKSLISTLIQRVIEGICAPYEVFGKKISTTVSIGVAFYPNDGETPDILLMNADSALYQVKNSGRNNFSLFTPELNIFLIS